MASTEKRIGFGKYKGRSYKEVCDNDPSYISWMASKKMSHNICVEDFRQYCIAITQRKFVYILPLIHGKFYVGTTSFPRKRLNQHCKGEGSLWTRKFIPMKGYSMLRLVPYDVEVGLFEDMWLKQVMFVHGIENTRGGSYCQFQLSLGQKEALTKELNHCSRQERNRCKLNDEMSMTPPPKNKRAKHYDFQEIEPLSQLLFQSPSSLSSS